jgi:CRISPR/Cas system Type II protein with McrA/HNH and RuvC-like nuclease domain
MAEVRGGDKQTRASYTKHGKSRLDGQQNPDYFKEYYAKNKERILERNKQRRKEREAAGVKNRITPQTWRSMVVSLLQQRDGDSCALCGIKLDFTNLSDLHIDHIIPYWYSRDDSAGNLQLAHKHCNMTRSRKYGH